MALPVRYCRFHAFPPYSGQPRFLKQLSIEQPDCVAGAGVVGQGKTVAIDLRNSEEEVWSAYRRQLRQSIRRAVHAGVRVVHDAEWQYLPDFIRLYYATMARNCAPQFYYFSPAFFQHLKASAGTHASLMTCLYGDEVMAAALITECDGIANILLLGADQKYMSLSPAKLLFHYAQGWARERGNRYLHFGGGRGSRDSDELFRFKRLFSNVLFPFYTGRWILDQQQYNKLLDEAHQDVGSGNGNTLMAEDFFPAYRTRR